MTAENRESKVRDLRDMLEQFESNLTDLVQQGRDLYNGMKAYGGEVSREGELLDSYLLRRIKSFLECNEQFRFDYARETLDDELEEIKAGVYEGEEV